MLYQVATKRQTGYGEVFSRPYLVVGSIEQATSQYHYLLKNTEDLLEAVVLEGEDYTLISIEYEHYTHGLLFRKVAVGPEAERERLEMAPLRPTYEEPVVKNRYRFDLFSQAEMRGYIGLMRRFLAGEIGGPDD